MAYNIGDKVTIKKSLDPGCNYNDYQRGFIKDMLKECGGKTLTIIDKRVCLPEPKCKYPSDGYLYVLEGGLGYAWTVGMFKSPGDKVEIKIKRQLIKLNYSL